MFPTERPRALLAFSIIALLIAAGIGYVAYADQHKRADDPVRYAELRCEGLVPKEEQRTSTFTRCVDHERSKSTIVSIFPLFLFGVLTAGFGIAGVVIGRIEVRKQKELEKRLAGELPEEPES
jgi:hypothetical protein